MPEWILPGRIARAAAIAGLLAAGGGRAGAQAQPSMADTGIAAAARALSAGDAGRAVELGTAYLKRHPADPRGHVLLARAHLERGNLDAAYLAVRRALAADPRSVDALYYQGLISARLAETEFQRLETSSPGSPRLHQLRAESLEAQDRRQAAEAEYEAALAIRPDLLDALLGLAKLRRTRLACDDAIPLYEKAESLQPTFEAPYGLGVCESARGNEARAVSYFQQAIERDPRAAVAWSGLGTSLNRLHRPADAITALERAVALEPDMGEAYYALGNAYQAQNDKAKAAAAFRKAEALAAGRDRP